MHDQTGELFLVREIDLESLPNAVLSLQIQVMSNIMDFFVQIKKLMIIIIIIKTIATET
jgi:hypothetical protein